MNVHHDFPTLASALGEAGADRLTFFLRRHYVPSTKRVRMIHNPLMRKLSRQPTLGRDRKVEDILVGICQLDWGSNGGTLTPSRLLAILASTENISSELLADVMAISERQARRYLAACKLAITHIGNALVPRELVRRESTLTELRLRLQSQQEPA